MAKVKKKKITVPVTIVTEPTPSLWGRIKGWFYHSETVFLAYVTSAVGVVMGLVGTFDFSPFWTLFQTGTEFTSKQLAWMGAGVLGSGITMYLARIHGTKDINGRLLPTSEK